MKHFGMQENTRVYVRDQQHSKRRKAARPTGRNELGLRQFEAILEEPAVRIPKRRQAGIDKARYENICVALNYFDDAAIRIDMPPLRAGDKAERGELSSFLKKRNEKSPGLT
jgi:hypothetical protein